MTTISRARLRLAGTALCGALMLSALGGCSGTAERPDACKLVDPAAAGKILGTTLTAKRIDTHLAGKNAASLCNYSSGRIKTSFLLIAAPLKAPNLAAEIARQKKSILGEKLPAGIPKPTISDVSGVGDGAFLVTMGPSLQLHAFAHGVSLVVSRNVTPSTDARDQTKQIAQLAIAGLK